METKATDLSARLLATENLTVVRAPVQTASFDIQARVLTLPVWKDMTPEIEDMLVGHEVAHALYTGEEYIKPIEANPKMMGYLNILEDVRIEKLIKRKYPGLRKRMNEGYRQLNDRDFFGVSKMPLDKLNLIDKINLYFKAGFQCGVSFDQDEKNLVNRAERTETIQDVIDLAEDIYKFSKEKAEEERKQKAKQKSQAPKGTDPDEDDDADEEDQPDAEPMDMEDDLDDVPSSPKEADKTEEEKEEEQLAPQTDRNFQDALADLADETTRYVYHKARNNMAYDPVIGYKQVLADTADSSHTKIVDYYKRRVYGPNLDAALFERKLTEDIKKFKNDSTSAVNYLVKEFEMKKSASQMKRSHTAKLGSLDMKKVWGYQINDDLFKRVTVLPDGKNHGMLFLLDWSGSMCNVIDDTLKQVINLAMFCNKVQIPYRVLAFTSQYNLPEGMNQLINAQQRQMDLDPEPQIIWQRGFHMLELFSSRMSMSEFNTMIRRVLDPRLQWHSGYGLGGTPLNEALIWVYFNIGKYMKENRIEKMNFITLTDGAGGYLNSTQHMARSFYNKGKVVNIKNMIRDDVSKKSYSFEQAEAVQTEALLKMIKDRYHVNVVGFYICQNRRSQLNCALRDNIAGFKGEASDMIDTMRRDFKDHGFYSMKGTGRDDLFIVPAESTKIDDSELEVTSNMSSRALSNQLGKHLNVKKTSRLLLSRFIEYIA